MSLQSSGCPVALRCGEIAHPLLPRPRDRYGPCAASKMPPSAIRLKAMPSGSTTGFCSGYWTSISAMRSGPTTSATRARTISLYQACDNCQSTSRASVRQSSGRQGSGSWRNSVNSTGRCRGYAGPLR